jgi:hypothetical protein
MKITIQEYEEDPSFDTTNAALRLEYTIDTNNNTNNNGSLPFKTTTNTSTTTTTSTTVRSSLWQSTRRIATQLFLPIGYPHSVDDTYLTYQLYDGLQGLCSYFRGVVSTKAVLEATGVGNVDATAYSAALQWALRDGTGMVGGLVFSYSCSPQFDTHVKEFRLFADVINDVALSLDMVAPYFGRSGRYGYYTLWILSASTLCKTMCGMSAGATKGRISQHFARHNGNMADLTAKESTQETLVSLLGMIGGIWVARLLEHAPMSVTWFVFWILTVLHVWANYKGVLQLKLATLNPERTRVLFQKWVRAVAAANHQGDARMLVNNNHKSISFALKDLPSPEEIQESLWSSTRHLLFPTLHVARPLDPQKLEYLSEFIQQNYVLGVDRRRHVYVWLRVGAGDADELQAYLHALVIQECLLYSRSRSSSSSSSETWDAALIKRTLQDVQDLVGETKSVGGGLLQSLEEKGWDMQSRFYLGFSQARIKWTVKDE